MNQWFDDINKLYLESKSKRVMEAWMGSSFHPRFKETTTDLADLGVSVPLRDAMILICGVLEEIGIISKEENNYVVKKHNAKERGRRFVEILSLHADEIKNASEIDEIYPIRLQRFFKVEAANRGAEGREEKYSNNAEERREKKEMQAGLKKLKTIAGTDGADAIEVFIGALDPAEEEVVGSYGQSLEDKTISFEIALPNVIDVGRVKNYIKEVIGDVEVSVERNKERGKIMPRFPEIKALIEFDVEPNTPLHDAILTHGEDKVGSRFEETLYNMDVESTVIISTPDDDPESKFKEFKKRLFSGKSSSIKVSRDFTDDDDDEDTDEEPKYDSALPPTPVMGDDEDRYYPRSSMRPSFTDDDEDDDESFSSRRLGYGSEEEEHGGARRSPDENEPEPRITDYDIDEADLDDDELSEYEKKRRDAINRGKKKAGKEEENNENIKMSPQQANIWMNQERARRMQNNLRQNERWGNYN